MPVFVDLYQLHEGNMSKNVQAQEEEIEALNAIYGGDFCTVIHQDGSTSHHIRVRSETLCSKGLLSLNMMLVFPEDYPSAAPPVYEVREAPLLDDAQLQHIADNLGRIYSETQGDVIVYQWVEWIREFLTTEAAKLHVETSIEGLEKELNDVSLQSSSKTTSKQPSPESSPTKVVTLPKAQSLYLQCPTILHGEPLTDRKSTFQAHAARITAVKEVEIVLSVLKGNRKIATATHNILAYRLYDELQAVYRQDCDDDGETAAGGRLLHLLQIMDARNVLVVVTRWYGGVQLHADRFKHINNVVRILLQDSGAGLQHKEAGSSGKKKTSPQKSKIGKHR